MGNWQDLTDVGREQQEREHCGQVAVDHCNGDDPRWLIDLLLRERAAAAADARAELEELRTRAQSHEAYIVSMGCQIDALTADIETMRELLSAHDAAHTQTCAERQKLAAELEMQTRATGAYARDLKREQDSLTAARAELETERKAREAAEKDTAQLRERLSKYPTQFAVNKRLKAELEAVQNECAGVKADFELYAREQKASHARLRTAAERAEHYICGNYDAIGYATGDSIRAEIRAALQSDPPAPTPAQDMAPWHALREAALQAEPLLGNGAVWSAMHDALTATAAVTEPEPRCAHEGIGLPGCTTCDPRTHRSSVTTPMYPAAPVEALLDCAEGCGNCYPLADAVRASKVTAAPSRETFPADKVRNLIAHVLGYVQQTNIQDLARELRDSEVKP